MERQIKESDWKLWKKVSDGAYQRFCQSTLDAVIKTANGQNDVFERYDKVHALLRTADKKITDAFYDVRRSTALQQLAYAVGEGMVSQEELSQFSDEAQEIVRLWLRL